MLHGYSEGNVNIGAYVSPETKRELVELAYENRRPVSEEIRVALKKHLRAEAERGWPRQRKLTVHKFASPPGQR